MSFFASFFAQLTFIYNQTMPRRQWRGHYHQHLAIVTGLKTRMVTGRDTSTIVTTLYHYTTTIMMPPTCATHVICSLRST